MKTIRLLYPDFVSGGLETYWFGAHLLQHILPRNDSQKLVQVEITPPDGKEKSVTEGITAEDEVLSGIRSAQAKLADEKPDRVITLGGNCLVSLASFDYLHGVYPDTGIVWIDAHPDVSTVDDGYPFAHAMVLGSLLGGGAEPLRRQMKSPSYRPDQVLYVGLQPLHDYQERFLAEAGVDYRVQDKAFVTDEEIRSFIRRFGHILVHFDIDVLDEHFFHSTYYANPELIGDGAGGGKMTMDKLSGILQLITGEANVVGLTIAEYLPFDEERLHKMLGKIKIFTEKSESSTSVRIDHIALFCKDLEGMRRFFIDHFSAVSNEQYLNPRTCLKTYILSFPGGSTRLEIMQRPDTVDADPSRPNIGFIHVSFAVGSREAVDAKTGELSDAGYRVVSGPRTTGDGYYESCIIGPEGIQIEITE